MPSEIVVRNEVDADIDAIAQVTQEAFFVLSFDGRMPQGTGMFRESFKAEA